MKSLIKLPLVAVAFAMAIPFTFAQDAGTPPPPPPGEQGGKPEGHKGQRGDRFKMLAEKLNLTEDQKAKIKPILEEEMKAMKAVMDDTTLDRDAKRPKIDEIRKSYREKILPLLTPDQVKKLDEIKERGPGGPRKEKTKE
jgi:Spy/CpxP family protein refolding chaperone